MALIFLLLKQETECLQIIPFQREPHSWFVSNKQGSPLEICVCVCMCIVSVEH